ncbi:MAG: VOC family protein [Acidimicrobiales bacterium]
MPTRLVAVVIDALDIEAQARWWSAALGWPITFEAVEVVVVEPEANAYPGAVPALTFVSVPEAKSVKNRIHLDLGCDSPEHQTEIVDRLLAAGATRVDVGQGDAPWVVLADPEGNELCVLEDRDHHRGRGPLASIVVDAADPATLARFWSEAGGWPIGHDANGVVSLHHPDGKLPDIDFVPVADARRVKNRVHLDVAPFADDPQAAEVDRLIALGAVPADVGQGPDVTWVVLADPEGNEFCVLSSR